MTDNPVTRGRLLQNGEPGWLTLADKSRRHLRTGLGRSAGSPRRPRVNRPNA
jgi:hypothetical protein